jgi:hypothetical protein
MQCMSRLGHDGAHRHGIIGSWSDSDVPPSSVHQVILSEPISFLAGNGPIIIRTAEMTDEDWQEVVRRETEERCS